MFAFLFLVFGVSVLSLARGTKNYCLDFKSLIGAFGLLISFSFSVLFLGALLINKLLMMVSYVSIAFFNVLLSFSFFLHFYSIKTGILGWTGSLLSTMRTLRFISFTFLIPVLALGSDSEKINVLILNKNFQGNFKEKC